MAVSHQGVYIQNPKTTPQSFVTADATTKKTLVTAGANGTKVVALNVTSTETVAAKLFQIWKTRAAVSYLLCAVNVPINSGFDGTTAAVNLLALLPGLATDNDGQRYFFLESGDTLQGNPAVAMSAGKELDVIADHGDY